MKLSPTEVRACLYAVAQYRRAAALGGRRVPPSVGALADRLDREIRLGVSPARHQIDSGAGQLEPENVNVELIGTRLAAQLLGWTARRVQRHQADLGGRIIGGRLVFNASTVREYRNGLENK